MKDIARYVEMSPFEIFIVIAIIGLITYIATVPNNLQYIVLSDPIVIVCILILGMIAFVCSPAAGLVVFLLIAVLFYKRNQLGVLKITQIPAQNHNNNNELLRPSGDIPAVPHNINNTDDMNIPEGQYQIDAARAYTNDKIGNVFTYKPGDEVSGNEFIRIGPNIDEKSRLINY